MTITIGQATEALLRRTRLHGSLGTTLSQAMQILSHCQRVVNAGRGQVTASNTFSTSAEKLVYTYRDQLTEAVDIIAMRDGNRYLHRFDTLFELTAYDPDWFRKIDGTQHEFFCQIGRDLLIIYPGQASADSLTAVYSKLTDEQSDGVAHYDNEMELDDVDSDIAVGLAEVLLLLKSRRIATAKERVARLLNDYGESI